MKPARAQALNRSLRGIARGVWIAGCPTVGPVSGGYSSPVRCLRPGIMRRNDAFGPPRWRSVIATTGVVLLLLALVGHSAMLPSHLHEPNPPHALLSSVGNEFAVKADHAHLVNDSLTKCHVVTAVAVLSRVATTLENLGTVAGSAAVAAVRASPALAVGRGQPRVNGLALRGQDLLILFCLARR